MSLVATEKIFETVTRSPEETMAVGRKLASELEPPCLVLLEGELGSGKTTLVKGIVAGLGAARQEEVTSPSFTLVHEYGAGRQEGHEGGAPLLTGRGAAPRVYHVDLYRIDDQRELDSLGLDDLVDTDAVVLVEWGEKLGERFGTTRVRIRMEHLGNDDRRITVERVVE